MDQASLDQPDPPKDERVELRNSIEEHALALSTGDLVNTSTRLFTDRLRNWLQTASGEEASVKLQNELLDKSKSSLANRDSLKKCLLSPLAQDIMFLLWRRSEFIDAEALRNAGLSGASSAERAFTVNSLKNSIIDEQVGISASASDALRKSISKVCVALEAYGLVEREAVRKNLKPIRGSQSLHELMLSIFLEMSELFARQIPPGPGKYDG